MLLGLFGCTIYFLLENYALTFTLASNVSILLAVAPISWMGLVGAALILVGVFVSDHKKRKMDYKVYPVES